METGNSNLPQALIQLASQSRFHPVFDYLFSLEWDRKLRLNRWMITYLGAPDTVFVREVSRISLIAAIRRIKYPGTKFDQIIILEGPEGKGKSSLLAALAVDHEWFSDQTIFGRGDREQQELLSGKWIYECAELQGLATTAVESIKAFASRQIDRARPAFGHFLENRPRTCIFFGTTNKTKYLANDGTGNRRIWPIETGKIDLEAFKRDVDQLWAEAWFRDLEDKEEITLHPALYKAAKVEQDARIQHDIWHEKIAIYLKTINREVGTFEIATGPLELKTPQCDRRVETRIGNCLTLLGWGKYRPTVDKPDGTRGREYRYYPPEGWAG
jgi:predicted P-loop ATPase